MDWTKEQLGDLFDEVRRLSGELDELMSAGEPIGAAHLHLAFSQGVSLLRAAQVCVAELADPAEKSLSVDPLYYEAAAVVAGTLGQVVGTLDSLDSIVLAVGRTAVRLS